MEKIRREKIRDGEDQREKVRREKLQVCEKAGRRRNIVFFQGFVTQKGRKSRLAKAAGAEPAGQMRDEKVNAVVARRTFGSKKHAMLGAVLEVEALKKCTPLWREAHLEVNSVNKKCQSPAFSEHFWKSRCRKSARLCGSKHILSHHIKISTSSNQFWTSICRPNVETVHAFVARNTFASKKRQQLQVWDHFRRSDVVLLTDRWILKKN